MCCGTAKWKLERDEEIVRNHKFDFVDVNEFYQRNCLRKIKYTFVFMVVLKSVLVYIADLWTAGILLIFNSWNSAVQPKIPFGVSKWIFLGCIFMSFGLLAWDMKKARAIIASRDISYAFTSIIAYRYYTLRSYAHYCFFSQIDNSKKKWDTIAYFVFFTFKGWKRLLFAEAPRQAINAFTLYSILESKKFSTKYNEYGDLVQRLAMVLMAFTLVIFLVSASLLLVAFILYLPLLCHIRGNLKEFLCHKIDKRIGELLKKKSKKRLNKHKAAAQAEAMGDFSHLKNKKGELTAQPFRQPTLPTVAFFDEATLPTVAYYDESKPTLPYSSPTPSHQYIPYENRILTQSPDPTFGAGPRAGPPGYGGPQGPPFVPGAAGQRPAYMSRRNSNTSLRSESTAVSGYTSSSPYRYQTPPPPMPVGGIQPKRSYNNIAAAQAAVTNQNTQGFSEHDDDLYGGIEDVVPEHGVQAHNENHSRAQYLGHYNTDSYDNGSYSQEYNNNNIPQNINNPNDININIDPYSPPASNRFEQHEYRSSPPRSGSPSPSIGSNRGGSSSPMPSRYQQETRSPRYNNYTQQPGRRGPAGGGGGGGY